MPSAFLGSSYGRSQRSGSRHCLAFCNRPQSSWGNSHCALAQLPNCCFKLYPFITDLSPLAYLTPRKDCRKASYLFKKKKKKLLSITVSLRYNATYQKFLSKMDSPVGFMILPSFCHLIVHTSEDGSSLGHYSPLLAEVPPSLCSGACQCYRGAPGSCSHWTPHIFAGRETEALNWPSGLMTPHQHSAVVLITVVSGTNRSAVALLSRVSPN